MNENIINGITELYTNYDLPTSKECARTGGDG